MRASTSSNAHCLHNVCRRKPQPLRAICASYGKWYHLIQGAMNACSKPHCADMHSTISSHCRFRKTSAWQQMRIWYRRKKPKSKWPKEELNSHLMIIRWIATPPFSKNDPGARWEIDLEASARIESRN